MKNNTICTLFMLILATASGLKSQSWDPATQAKGWAFQDVDGSLFFYDVGSHSLRQWQKGGGLLSSQSLPLPEPRMVPKAKPMAAPQASSGSDYEEAGALLYGIPAAQRALARHAKPVPKVEEETPATCDAIPERWVLDTYNRVWVICEGRLVVIGKNGKLNAVHALPGEVEDIAADHDGIYLNYRTLKPYVEKRSIKDGDVVWTYGDKAALKEALLAPLLVPLNRMAVRTDGTVYLAEGGGLTFTVLDSDKGPKAPGQSFFTYRETVASRANLGHTGRGPLLVWAGKDVIFSAFSGSQLKGTGAPEAKGVVLARFDLAKGSLDWIPTSLTEDHELVGLLDHEAIFLNAKGGLSYAPIR